MMNIGKPLVVLAYVAVLLVLGACGKEPPTESVVLNALKVAGVEYGNVRHPARDPDSPLPNSYKEHFSVTLPSIAPKGGQFFICEKKEYCDAIYSYFNLLQGLAGPYLYQSKDGLVIAQMNSGLAVADAEKIRGVINGL